MPVPHADGSVRILDSSPKQKLEKEVKIRVMSPSLIDLLFPKLSFSQTFANQPFSTLFKPLLYLRRSGFKVLQRLRRSAARGPEAQGTRRTTARLVASLLCIRQTAAQLFFFYPACQLLIPILQPRNVEKERK